MKQLSSDKSVKDNLKKYFYEYLALIIYCNNMQLFLYLNSIFSKYSEIYYQNKKSF